MNKLQMIKSKANYCLSCPNPMCIKGCPLGNDIKGFIKKIKSDDYKGAYDILTNTTLLSSVCGRICPHSKQCEGHCVRRFKGKPVSIGTLEAFIGDEALKNNYPISKHVRKRPKYNVAVIGGGPAGLMCAGFLRKNGIGVTIYERHYELGGIMMHSIPNFRLPETKLNKDILKILDMGINVSYGMELGVNLDMNDLISKHDAVFIGVGGNLSNKMGIPGEDLNNCYGANELLEGDEHLDFKNKIIAVIGGGNVAMDMARICAREDAKKVMVIYRRSESEMPAETKEIEAAKKDGVKFLFQHNIVGIHGEREVSSIDLVKTKLVKVESDTRPHPVNIDDSLYNIKCDYVFEAVGSHVDSNLIKSLGVKLDDKNHIIIDEDGKTSNPKVFAGGDVCGTISTVAYAARDGRNAAFGIIKYLNDLK